MFYFDPYYLYFVVPALIIAMIAQFKVNSAFKKYSQIANRRGYTGAYVARHILDSNGLTEIAVERVSGNLTDHYDPAKKVIRLSDSVYDSTSVASLGVAAHETGHAIQHSISYVPLKLRTAIFPVVRFSSSAAIPLALLGFILQWGILVNIGLILFAAVVAFQLITLPVEFNASSRAIEKLEEYSMLDDDEIKPAKKVLSAAAMTYVASVIVAIANLLRLFLLLKGRND